MEQHTAVVAIALGDEGVELTYVRVPQDIRKNGLAWTHSVQIPRGSDYDDELEELADALNALLTDVLEDEPTAEPIELPERVEDEREAGDGEEDEQ